ncbi:MAG: hypothetical protein CMB56_003410 [Methanobacteriota archaeon]|nr:MAG: hypothetical protein CMB56_003410 [Euryarchaeota archaeon]
MKIGLKLHIIIHPRFDTMRILIFEDTYDIIELVKNTGINLEGIEIKQFWDTENSTARIKKFSPDILLLDYYIEPISGLQVIKKLNIALENNQIVRPKKIIGISSSSSANSRFVQAGADDSIIKFELANLDLWNRDNV